MEMPIPLNPQMNANVDDHSKTDESINQSGVTIQAGDGSTINTNSGNGSRKPHENTIWKFLGLVCFALVIWTSANVKFNTTTINEIKTDITSVSQKAETAISESRTAVSEAKKAMENSKEGTIWILRRDILNSIDYHTATTSITSKAYTRIKDQFDYYHSIGGNHDVESRFDEFKVKIFGTGEIKMVK